MKPTLATLISSGLCFGLAAAALAMPPVMDRVPDDAMIVGLIPAPETLQKDVGALGTAIEFPIPIQDVSTTLSMAGIHGGVDTTKAIAFVVVAPPKPEGNDPKNVEDLSKAFDNADQLAIVLLPITNYADFLKNFEAKPSGAGKTDSIKLGGDTAAYTKDLGDGYAAISMKQSLIDGFTGKSGADSFKSKMGRAGENLADRSDVAFVFNMDTVRPYVPQMIEELKKQAKERAEAMGQSGPKVEAQAQAASWLVETTAAEARVLVAGAKLGALGVGLDFAANFKEGSMFGKAFASGGKPDGLMNKLPGQDCLFAGAFDQSMAGFRALMIEMVTKSLTATSQADTVKTYTDTVNNVEGQAVAVGFPKGGALAGLLTSTITFIKSKDPNAYTASVRKTMKDGKFMDDPALKSGDYAENAAKVGETSVDVWSVKLATNGQGNPMLAQGSQFLFGPGDGPSGYLAKVDGGVFMTFSKNSELLGKALKLAPADSLASNALISQVREQLPGDRIGEGYLGTKSVLDLVTPFIAMIGVPIPMDKIPEQLPPVGFSLSGENGAAHTRLFVPAPVIKTGVMIATAVTEQMNQGDAAEPEPKGDHKGGKGTGQPKF